MELAGKVALVTGAGSGIGKAAALRFAKEGAKVGALSDTASEVEATVGQIIDGGGEAHALVADVANAEQMERAIAEVSKKFGRLDIVYANAGINGVYAPVEELAPEEWDRTLAINLRGTFLTVKYAIPPLKKAGGGAILVTSSINGSRVFSNFGGAAYATSKAAQLAFAKVLALELARDKIRVNIICPGSIETDIHDNMEKRHIDKIKIKTDFEVDVPLTGKPGSAEEVAELALFLVSDRARHITGSPVWIDGAQSLLRG